MQTTATYQYAKNTVYLPTTWFIKHVSIDAHVLI